MQPTQREIVLLWKRSTTIQKPRQKVGISANAAGIALVYGDFSSSLATLSCEFLPCTDLKQQEELLAVAIGDRHLEGNECCYTLTPHDYRLLLLDAPDVPEKELAAAAQWLVKDLIDFPVEEAAVDAFPIPVRASQSAKIYVVVCRKQFLQQIVRLVKLAGLKLAKVGIYDLALRNILSLYPEITPGIAALCLDKDYTNLLIAKDNLVYLTRPLDESMLVPIAAEEVKAISEQSSAEPVTAVSKPEKDYHQQSITTYNIANLVLEIQRSFDYYQSQLGQAFPTKLLLTPGIEIEDSLRGELSQNLAVAIDRLDLNALFKFQKPLPLDLQAHCLGAVGGIITVKELATPNQSEQDSHETGS